MHAFYTCTKSIKILQLYNKTEILFQYKETQYKKIVVISRQSTWVKSKKKACIKKQLYSENTNPNMIF